MDRRQFLTGVAAAGGLGWAPRAGSATDQPLALPRRQLGRTGAKVTILGLGGFTGMKEPRSARFDPVELANAAIDAGIHYFDTAPAYNNGQSERNYGEVLALRRKEVFLACKTDRRTYDGAMRQVEASLKRLRTDRLDLLQIHNTHVDEDLAAWGKPGGVVKALEKLRDEKVLPIATRKGMGILAMKVMGGALGSLVVGNPKKNDGAPNHDDAPQQAEAAALIRYVLGLPVAAAVVGMKSLEQLQINVAGARSRPLDGHQRKVLEASMGGSSSK